MKLSIYVITIVMWAVACVSLSAQENNNSSRIAVLEDLKETVINEEKDALKVEVENINQMLEAGTITEAEASQRKKEVAEKRALNIENRIAIIDNKIALLQRNADGEVLQDDEDRFVLSIGGKDDRGFVYFGPDNKKRKYDRRTTSDFVLAVGFNNVIMDGEDIGDTYKLAGSRFAELGWAWKTRVFKNSNWLRVKYGFSFQFNGLKPTDNRYFVDNGDQTALEVFPVELDKSKFRIDNLVVPVHFEIGPSKKIEGEDYFRYSTRNKVKLGIGGYAGVKLGARQKLRFKQDGEKVEQKIKGDYNTNNFIYGVSAYLGWRDTALYVKYDLNTIFKDNPVEQRNISLGLRFDMD